MSAPGKLVESIIKDEIIKNKEEWALLKVNQHGFCQSKSCHTNLLVFSEDINRHVDRDDDPMILYT